MKYCEGNGDNCTTLAVTSRQTSDGWLAPEWFCGNCAADYDRFIANYDGPEADGEAMTAAERASFEAEQMARIQRELK